MSTLEDRLNFFVGAYFKITPMDLQKMGNQDIAKHVVCKCVDKAYQDLKRRIPYEYSASKIKTLDHKEKTLYCNYKESFRKEISDMICDYLVVIKAQYSDVIDSRNLNPCELIENVIECANRYQELFENNTTFTVGLAQKWVNMTLKYLWILGVLDDEYDENLDVPLDSYILDEVAKLGIDVNKTKWSQLNSLSEYKEIQTAIKKVVLEEYGCTAIKWENENWIKAICAKN